MALTEMDNRRLELLKGGVQRSTIATTSVPLKENQWTAYQANLTLADLGLSFEAFSSFERLVEAGKAERAGVVTHTNNRSTAVAVFTLK